MRLVLFALLSLVLIGPAHAQYYQSPWSPTGCNGGGGGVPVPQFTPPYQMPQQQIQGLPQATPPQAQQSPQIQQLMGVPPAMTPPAALAVMRVPSHGASATVIYSTAGKTYLLGCAHAYEGRDAYKQTIVDMPNGKQLASVVKVDYHADLSLIRVDDGPYPYVASVPSRDYRPAQLVSAGYDRMGYLKSPSANLCTTYTYERPIPGRSGGGLIDPATGVLIGVCQGYEVRPHGRGMYVSQNEIRSFLQTCGWGAEQQAQPAQPQYPVAQQYQQPQYAIPQYQQQAVPICRH